MTYSRTAWATGNSVTAALLNNIEAGIYAADFGMINVKAAPYNAVGNDSADDTAAIQAALTASNATSTKVPIYFPPGTYKTTAALTPFTGMRLLGYGRGAEFSHSAIIHNADTDTFTPAADVSDIHIENLQFKGDFTNTDTDWWTVGTGFKLQYSTIEKCGFNYFKRVFHGQWVGVTFKDFYENSGANNTTKFNLTGADSIFGPGFLGTNVYQRTTLTASVTAGAGPKTLTVASPTGAFVGGVVYVSDTADGSSGTRDVTTVTGISGNDLTVGTLANAHASGQYVHIILNIPAVQTELSHSKHDRLYISPGVGMALHVTGGHTSTFFDCDLSGVPMQSAGPGIYVVDSDGHQFIGCSVDQVALKNWSQFNGAVVVYDSTDISFIGTKFAHMTAFGAASLFRIGRSGSGGVRLTDRVTISGTKKYDVNAAVIFYSANSNMAVANAKVLCDEFYEPLWFPTYKTASYYFCNSPASTGTSNTLTNGTVRLAAWTVTQPLTITKIGAEFTAAGDAASVFRIGVYADDGTGVPAGSPVLDAGSISTGTGNAGTVATGGTPGSYEITLGTALTLQPGLYWVGGVVQGVTTTQPTIRTVGAASMILPMPQSGIPAANATNFGYQLAGVTGALGAWSGTTQAGTVPRIFYKTQ